MAAEDKKAKETSPILESIRVIDVSQVAAMPLAARNLADFGADVIHVEHPLRGDTNRVFQAGAGGTAGAPSHINYNWEFYNRNKRGMGIDLSQERGREIIYKLVKTADVFMTNLRPFEQEKFGVEYSTLSHLNPRLIYCSLTGYGRKGPERNSPGYDQTAYWYRAGIPHVLTWPGALPPCFQMAFGDNVAALALLAGIMMALFVRERTGVGQEVDLSLFHLGVQVNSFNIGGALNTGLEYDEWRRQSPEARPNPLSNIYKTKDGRWLALVMTQSDRYWSRFCKAIEREDLEHDPKFDSFETRKQNHVTLFHILGEVFRSKNLTEWTSCLTEAGLPIAPMNNLQEIVNDPQAIANDFFVPYDHPNYGPIKVIANPLHLSKVPSTLRMPAPELGQHTEEILLELGYTWEDITTLKDAKVI